MSWDIYYIFWHMVDNYIVIVLFIALVLLPLLLLMLLIRLIIDKLRRIKRINNVIISEFAWQMLSYEAKLDNISTRKRIQRILDFITRQEDLFNKVKD